MGNRQKWRGVAGRNLVFLSIPGCIETMVCSKGDLEHVAWDHGVGSLVTGRTSKSWLLSVNVHCDVVLCRGWKKIGETAGGAVHGSVTVQNLYGKGRPRNPAFTWAFVGEEEPVGAHTWLEGRPCKRGS